MKTSINALLFGILVSLYLFTGCSKNENTNNSLDPFQPQITNANDNFQLQGTNVKQVTTTIDYNWSNTGTMATIDKSGIVTADAAKILLYDKNGTNVYADDLKVTGNQTSTT